MKNGLPPMVKNALAGVTVKEEACASGNFVLHTGGKFSRGVRGCFLMKNSLALVMKNPRARVVKNRLTPIVKNSLALVMKNRSVDL